MGGVAGLGGEHEPVQEPAAFGRAIEEQPILGRGQPDQPKVVAQPRRRNSLAVYPDRPPRRSRGFHARADLQPVVIVLDPGRNAPGAALGLPRLAPPQLGDRRATQAPAGR